MSSNMYKPYGGGGGMDIYIYKHPEENRSCFYDDFIFVYTIVKYKVVHKLLNWDQFLYSLWKNNQRRKQMKIMKRTGYKVFHCV